MRIALAGLLFVASGSARPLVLEPIEPREIAHPPVRGYLLFDVIFTEQLNKQRRALMFFLNVAMQLRRTLVLPRARLLQRVPGRTVSNDLHAEYVRWGQLFNLSTLNRLHPVVEIESFLEEHGHIERISEVPGFRGCGEEGAKAVEFNGLRVKVRQSHCDGRMRYQFSELAQVPESSLAFLGSSDQLSPTLALPMRPYVRFEQGVYESAAAFVRETLGGQPFVAVHWRRTDFLVARRTQPGVLQSPAEMIAHVEQLLRKHGIERVYLATDSDDATELARVNARLNPARYAPAAEATSLHERAVGANVEITICAMASFFLGTRTSSYTLAIMEEREAVFGHSPESAREMHQLPPEALEPTSTQPLPKTPVSKNPPRSPPSPPRPSPPQPSPPPAAGASSPPPSPPTRIRARERFLLFEVPPGESLDTQRRSLLFFLDAAMRAKRTLVLPRAQLLPGDAGWRPASEAAAASEARESEFVKCGQIYNLSHLNRLHPAIELETYLLKYNRVERLSEVAGKQGCTAEGHSEIGFNGLKVKLRQHACDQMRYDAEALLAASEHVSLGFTGPTSPLPLATSALLRPYVRFDQRVYAAAAAFVERAFGGASFVAVHWRTQRLDAAPLVAQVEEELSERGHSRIFLSTEREGGADDAEQIARVLERLRPASYVASAEPAATALERLFETHVEIVICAMAEFFIGARSSARSLNIIEERQAVFEKPLNTAVGFRDDAMQSGRRRKDEL